MRSALRGLSIGFVVLAILAAAASRVVEAGITEYYSPEWRSPSSVEGARRGVLVRRPPLRAELVTYRGAPLRVTDAWIEQVTHVEYPWFVWRREVRDSGLRLVVLARRDRTGTPEVWCDESLSDGYDDRFVRSGTSREPEWYSIRKPGIDPP